MNIQLANFSTDLRRISSWSYYGKDNLVNNAIKKAKETYKINRRQGPYKNIWEEIDKIRRREGGRIKAADRAMTLSVILLQRSLKKH